MEVYHQNHRNLDPNITRIEGGRLDTTPIYDNPFGHSPYNIHRVNILYYHQSRDIFVQKT